MESFSTWKARPILIHFDKIGIRLATIHHNTVPTPGTPLFEQKEHIENAKNYSQTSQDNVLKSIHQHHQHSPQMVFSRLRNTTRERFNRSGLSALAFWILGCPYCSWSCFTVWRSSFTSASLVFVANQYGPASYKAKTDVVQTGFQSFESYLTSELILHLDVDL